jgi:hypothetical protein
LLNLIFPIGCEAVEKGQSYWALKFGLFLVVLAWFSYTLYHLAKAIINGVAVPFTDMPSLIGLGFRASAGFIALVTILFYLVKRDFSITEAVTSLRWVVLLEAAYWATLLPSAIWGFQTSYAGYPREFIIVETGLPCLVEAILMPIALGALCFSLSSKKPVKAAIKRGLIAATATIFTFWFNYSMQWFSDMILSGVGFITSNATSAFAFALTAGGLFILTLYAGVYTKRFSGTEILARLDLKKAGIITTAFGLFFVISYLLWLLFNVPNGTSVWKTFFIGHNVDLWLMALPLVGLPLIFSKNSKAE